MAHEGLTTTSARSLGLVERLPVRRIILTILTVAVVTFVAVGTYKTLTLSGADHLGWAFWANLLVIGLALGAVYALIALGYTLVYGILRMINFAHGEVFMWGAFGSFFFATAYAKSGFMNSHPWAALAILFVSAIAISTGVAVLLERVAYRPLRNAPRLVPLITAIGASLFLQNTAQGSAFHQRRDPMVLRRADAGLSAPLDPRRDDHEVGRELRQDRSHRDRDLDRGDGGPRGLREADQDREVDARRGTGS